MFLPSDTRTPQGKTSTESSLREAALAYRRKGLCVIPLRWTGNIESRKKPKLDSWKAYQTEPPHMDEVEEWWTRWPEANIGIPTGPVSGVVVFDVDFADLARAKETLGWNGETWTATTGKGFHFYFAYPTNGSRPIENRAGILPGVDVRGAGGYVVAPPSVHGSGRQYEWLVSPEQVPLAPLPARLLALLTAPAAAVPAGSNGTIPTGARNDTLYRLGRSLVLKGLSGEAITAALRAENAARCDPPLSEGEVSELAAHVVTQPNRPRTEPAGGSLTVEHLTDLGNARRLVARFGDRFRWCEAWGCFLTWDGRRWAKDDSGQVMRWAKDTSRAVYAEAADCADKDTRKEIGSHALKMEADAKLRAMVNLAKSEEGTPIAPSAFDRDPWLLNVESGVLDLRTGLLLDHRPEDFISKLAPVTWDPEATAPTWEAFLQRILAGDVSTIGFLQRMLGYCLTGITSEQVWALLHGPGANGKSTLVRTVIDLLGDYAAWTPAKTLLAKRGEAADNDLARLRGARLVAAVETDGGRRLAEALVKQLTGGDKIAARFLYGEYFEFAPEFKLWLATNHKPTIQGTDHATWRRVRLVPFVVEIPEAEQDKDLLGKLRAEFPGILRWAVDGCLAWQRDGLGTPEAVREATAEYRASQDLIGAFLAECCEAAEEETAGATDLYRAYVAWCEQGKERPETQTVFGEALNERGFPDKRHSVTRRKVRVGIRLLSERMEPDSETP